MSDYAVSGVFDVKNRAKYTQSGLAFRTHTFEPNPKLREEVEKGIQSGENLPKRTCNRFFGISPFDSDTVKIHVNPFESLAVHYLTRSLVYVYFLSKNFKDIYVIAVRNNDQVVLPKIANELKDLQMKPKLYRKDEELKQIEESMARFARDWEMIGLFLARLKLPDKTTPDKKLPWSLDFERNSGLIHQDKKSIGFWRLEIFEALNRSFAKIWHDKEDPLGVKGDPLGAKSYMGKCMKIIGDDMYEKDLESATWLQTEHFKVEIWVRNVMEHLLLNDAIDEADRINLKKLPHMVASILYTKSMQNSASFNRFSAFVSGLKRYSNASQGSVPIDNGNIEYGIEPRFTFPEREIELYEEQLKFLPALDGIRQRLINSIHRSGSTFSQMKDKDIVLYRAMKFMNDDEVREIQRYRTLTTLTFASFTSNPENILSWDPKKSADKDAENSYRFVCSVIVHVDSNGRVPDWVFEVEHSAYKHESEWIVKPDERFRVVAITNQLFFNANDKYVRAATDLEKDEETKQSIREKLSQEGSNLKHFVLEHTQHSWEEPIMRAPIMPMDDFIE